MLRRVRRLLAERSRRGRVASAALAGLAVLAGVLVLIVLFPRRDEPRVEVALATADPLVEYPPPLRVWPGTGVVVRGDDLTGASGARVRLAGRDLGTYMTSPDGELRVRLAIPADAPAGAQHLSVRDLGSGREVRTPVIVEDPSSPGIAIQPAGADGGETVVVAGGGLPGTTAVEAVLDPGPSERLLRAGRTTRAGLLVLLVILPDELGDGEHVIGLRAAGGGEPLAPPAPLGGG
jgi:hypothetical protein